ncbi:MAG: phosphatidate cytidylyltransferase, partial [Bdellovibrionales bacterium]|nr:phosphatidate cytidylyltransferase [Bdellovibrionales bacterium]
MFTSLQNRFITGAILAVLFILLLFLPSYSYSFIWGIFFLLSFAIFAAPLEFIRFSTDTYQQRQKVFGYALSLFSPLLLLFLFGIFLIQNSRTNPEFLFSQTSTSLFSPLESQLIIIAALLFSFLLSSAYCFLVPKSSLEHVSRELGELLLAVLLFVLGGGSLLFLPLLWGGCGAIAWLVLVVASNDTSAYFIGQRFGKMKLSETISPGKTRIGSLGGLVVGTIIGSLFSWLLPDYLRISPVVLMALVIVLIAQLGDLSKSFLKRMHQVKD